MFRPLACLALLSAVAAQTCKNAVGPCVMGACPNQGQTCLPDDTCCPNNAIIPAPGPGAPAVCADKINSATGKSDCQALCGLCNNSAYYSLMTEQCPKTCGRCPAGSTPCADKINVNTGKSDCPGSAHLCHNSAYNALMKEQCPKTCGYCK